MAPQHAAQPQPKEEHWLNFSYLQAPRFTIGPMEVEVSSEDMVRAQLIQSAGFQFEMEDLAAGSGIYRFQIVYEGTTLYDQYGTASSSKRTVHKLLGMFKAPHALGIKQDIDAEIARTNEENLLIEDEDEGDQ
jgi:hypothetical protein